jgi:hypothetical protein
MNTKSCVGCAEYSCASSQLRTRFSGCYFVTNDRMLEPTLTFTHVVVVIHVRASTTFPFPPIYYLFLFSTPQLSTISRCVRHAAPKNKPLAVTSKSFRLLRVTFCHSTGDCIIIENRQLSQLKKIYKHIESLL